MATIGLVALMVPVGVAQARVIYCASDEEAADLKGGLLTVILGPKTRLVEKSNVPSGRVNTIWAGQAQQCPPTAKDACSGRVDHAESTSYSRMKSIGVAGDLTGTGTVAHWLPIASAHFGYSRTRTTGFDVALMTNIYPGETWQPVVNVSESTASGYYIGGYRYVGEGTDCHQYALDPNLTFGAYRATLQDDPVSTWRRR